MLVGLNSLHNSLSGLAEQVGNSMENWCSVSQRELLYENYAIAINRWEQISYIEKLDLPGGERWWLTSLMPIKSVSRIYRIIGSALDITNTRHTENALSTFLPIMCCLQICQSKP